MEKTKQIEVKDKQGNRIGVFNCRIDGNPLLRLQAEREKLQCAANLLRFTETTADGRAAHKTGRPKIIKAERAIFDVFEALAPGAYKAFFAEIKPFAAVGGKFYCENCLEAIKHYFEEGEDKHGKEN